MGTDPTTERQPYLNIKEIRVGDHVAIFSRKLGLGAPGEPLHGEVLRLGDGKGHLIVIWRSNNRGAEFRIHGRSIIGLWKDYEASDAQRLAEEVFNAKRKEIENELQAEATLLRREIGSMLADRLRILDVDAQGGSVGYITIRSLKGLRALLAIITPAFEKKVLGDFQREEGNE